MRPLFVAGAGTDVGKTHVTAGLIRALLAEGRAVRAIKPLASGFDPEDWAESDPGRLLAALGQAPTLQALDAITPWRYRAALSPDMAAAREGAQVDFDAIAEFCRARAAESGEGLLLVEGVGGVMSPISAETTNLDWMLRLGAPVLLVGGSYLGSISHTLTAARVLQGAGLSLAAIVASESQDAGTPFGETVDSLARLSGLQVIGAGRDASWAEWATSVIETLGDAGVLA